MVKGVNKTVIEVNNTGSRMFEKIVFYVTPQYGNLSAKQLQKAAQEFSFQFGETKTNIPLRKKHLKLQKKRRILLTGAVILAVVTVAVIVFL